MMAVIPPELEIFERILLETPISLLIFILVVLVLGVVPIAMRKKLDAKREKELLYAKLQKNHTKTRQGDYRAVYDENGEAIAYYQRKYEKKISKWLRKLGIIDG